MFKVEKKVFKEGPVRIWASKVFFHDNNGDVRIFDLKDGSEKIFKNFVAKPSFSERQYMGHSIFVKNDRLYGCSSQQDDHEKWIDLNTFEVVESERKTESSRDKEVVLGDRRFFSDESGIFLVEREGIPKKLEGVNSFYKEGNCVFVFGKKKMKVYSSNMMKKIPDCIFFPYKINDNKIILGCMTKIKDFVLDDVSFRCEKGSILKVFDQGFYVCREKDTTKKPEMFFDYTKLVLKNFDEPEFSFEIAESVDFNHHDFDIFENQFYFLDENEKSVTKFAFEN
jgi:hypothetical protein